ncbi:MAG: type II secretion system F family protein [Candidatus Altiarchaeota archaeon]
MTSFLESRSILKMSEPLVEFSRRLEPLFPQMEWDLRRSGYTLETKQYIAVIVYMTIVVLFTMGAITLLFYYLEVGFKSNYSRILFIVVPSIVTPLYLTMIPKVGIKQRAMLIDRDLEFMLKDMQIQLSSGVPLFDTLVNIARGEYGECSLISGGIIQEVEQGKSITEVLDNVGMWSPSEHLRKTLWQIVNAIKSGSDVVESLNAISNDIRIEKENRIKAYGKELNLWGLIYMMCGIVIPSMGVTLLVILSSFMGRTFINEQLFYLILLIVAIFHAFFISFVKSKRPNI